MVDGERNVLSCLDPRRCNLDSLLMDWNAAYEKSETPWEKGRATPVLDEVFERHRDVLRGRVLVPGCGIGHDARRLSEMGLQVTGVDIAPLAIQAAREWEVSSPVEFREMDIFAPPDEFHEAFDLIWEHTCLCALDPGLRKAYLKSLHALLMPGGNLAGVFFIDPEMDEGEAGPPFGIEVSALQDLCREAGFEVLDFWVPVTGYEGRIGRELAMVLEKAAAG
jgi:SAM-dependent methyltransferase